ncbi:cytochrome c oxidase accessory protein CcoG [Emticicia sp. BO119]|uniref:cytochrome c oxidase accessory protein CcoG n=1 Tax=Emticicia sp. BO119 TaxID=2757768 RepID=UPI0015F055B3|nr:cytochrome c oxidase accessory protein CcoG [Emticicia sp. BO119]MBA4848898.1 cytochrome c oxidase accessory protein CcoG [Emticicia sp. BO119]
MSNLDFIDEAYRDSIATVDSEGKRIWVYPKKPGGRYHNYRIIATIIFLGLFFLGPFIKINGHPLLMINIFERKFVLFGQLFLPQDSVIFSLGLITFFIFITLFTVVYGRFWCGWACPQTVFMEMVFRKIEYWIEGDRKQQIALNNAPWTARKIVKKGGKRLVFLLISILIAHTTMAYLIGIEATKKIITHSPAEHLPGFIGLVAFTGIFYYVFTVLREQVCTSICPYGRLQGVLMGRNTINIIYDWVRGEPRGKINKHEPAVISAPKGDCIDCKLCVQVCPTGIDIRNGSQLECTNCTACIDACDDVMIKINKPTGLIKFGSVESIEKRVPFKLSPRAYAYSVVLLLLIGVEAFLLLSRSAIETTVMRVPGQMYQEQPNNQISNLYNAQIVNKSNQDMEVSLKVADNHGIIRLIDGKKKIKVLKGGKADVVFFLEMDKAAIKKIKTNLKIEVWQGEDKLETIKTTFLGFRE